MTACAGADKSADTNADTNADTSADKPRNIVKPADNGMPAAVASPVPDGGYHAAFDAAQADTTTTVTVTFYNYDLYVPADIDNIKTGDGIASQGKIVDITQIASRTDESDVKWVDINGGNTADGLSLRLDDDGRYHTVAPDGYALYYEIGTADLDIAPNVNIIDEYDPEQMIRADGIDVLRQIKNKDFGRNVTVITVKNNRITHILRLP